MNNTGALFRLSALLSNWVNESNCCDLKIIVLMNIGKKSDEISKLI